MGFLMIPKTMELFEGIFNKFSRPNYLRNENISQTLGKYLINKFMYQKATVWSNNILCVGFILLICILIVSMHVVLEKLNDTTQKNENI